jgi:hypothetical protein
VEEPASVQDNPVSRAFDKTWRHCTTRMPELGDPQTAQAAMEQMLEWFGLPGGSEQSLDPQLRTSLMWRFAMCVTNNRKVLSDVPGLGEDGYAAAAKKVRSYLDAQNRKAGQRPTQNWNRAGTDS